MLFVSQQDVVVVLSHVEVNIPVSRNLATDPTGFTRIQVVGGYGCGGGGD